MRPSRGRPRTSDVRTLSSSPAALCRVVSLSLASTLVLGLCACASSATGDAPVEAASAATASAARPQAASADVAGTVSVRAAADVGEGKAEAAGGDVAAAGTVVYTNERLGFVAELPAEYALTEATYVVGESDAVVLSAADERSDACLILTHDLGEAEGADDGTDAGAAGGADAEDADDAVAAAVRGAGEGEADEAQAVPDPIDEWARTYAARATDGLEGDGATVTRARIGRATLGGAPCTIVEIEFLPAGVAARPDQGEATALAHRDIFFFDGRDDRSRLGLVVDCLAWSQEALDALEDSFVAR